jgi:thiosulfate dehydrogenase [quinone] large subunit
MLSAPSTTTAPPLTGHVTVPARLRAVARWPFTSSSASPIWLAVRLYLGYVWLTMGMDKIGSGFLTGDPIGQMLGFAGSGALPVPVEAYRPVARWLVELGVTPLLSHSMPFLEIAVALAFISGILVVPAAVGAVFLNLNFLLSGVGIVALDGRCIALQLLLILAFRVAGYIGVQRMAGLFLKRFVNALRGRRTVQLPSS